MTDRARGAIQDAFRAHERFVWGLLYRMTGSAADADDLLQETFARAIERPPKRIDDPLRPWLVRVAINLAKDELRKRKRRGYVGPWLPSPIELGPEDAPPSYEPAMEDGQTTEGRYDLLESVSLAFLLAIEALTPQQRAVLILRDVFDYSVEETAEALAIGAANVKTTLHRARRRMESYETERSPPSREAHDRALSSLTRFLEALAQQDVQAIESVLAEDVRSLTDGGGERIAALRPVIGVRKVRAFFQKLTEKRGVPSWFEVRSANGMPAVLMEWSTPGRHARDAMRLALAADLDRDGRIRAVHVIMAERKLKALSFASRVDLS
jgi:RNA polymerase sigma-70 factor (ECF subfamily)